MNENVIFKFFMLRIGLPVMVALIASLFVAMVFIPLAATKIVRNKKVQEPKSISVPELRSSNRSSILLLLFSPFL